MSTKTASDLSIVTTEHPNAVRLREGFAAFGRGDLDTVRATMAPDCTWTIPGSTELSGEYRGWEEISGMFGRLFEATGGTFSMDVVSCLADDRNAVAIYDATSTVAGQTRTMRFVLIEELDDAGLTVHTTSLAFDQAAADAHMNGAVPQQRG